MPPTTKQIASQGSALDQYSPPLVISAHGIRTAARWQKSLAEILSNYGIKHRAYDFGHYGLFRFANPSSRQRKLSEFYDFYSTLTREREIGINLTDYRSRPSIIAHSFGAYIVGHAMQKYPDIRFDKVILCGAILPVDFDWSTLFHRDQVNFVRNEYGARDFWASIVENFISGTGASGTKGFDLLSTVVSQERFEYFRHSDYFHKQHVESHWLPVLRKEPSPLQIRHGRNMDGDFDTFVSTLNATAQIDELCFGKLPGYEGSRVPRGLSTTWIEVNPDIYTFLFDRRTDKVVGYINAMPVRRQCYDKVKTSQIKDNEISSDDVTEFLRDQILDVYMMSVAIDPTLRRANQGLFQEPFERLMTAFIGKLYYYAVNRRIRVAELVAVGWTDQGKKLAEAFGMEKKGSDLDGHPIYLLSFEAEKLRPLRLIAPAIAKLSQTYRDMAPAPAEPFKNQNVVAAGE